MDHDKPVVAAEKKYTDKQCAHGRCLNHDPSWENVGETEHLPDLGIFGVKRNWKKWCCGKPMPMYKVVQKQQCRRCGRTREQIVYTFARCFCCGYQITY